MLYKMKKVFLIIFLSFFLIGQNVFSEADKSDDARKLLLIQNFYSKISISKNDNFFIEEYTCLYDILNQPIFNLSTMTANPARETFYPFDETVFNIDFDSFEVNQEDLVFENDDAVDGVEIFDAAIKDSLKEGIDFSKVFTNEKGLLITDWIGEEVFSVEKNVLGNKCLVYANEDSLVQSVYDDFMRLSKKTVWTLSKNKSDIADISLIISYGYASDESDIPNQITEHKVSSNEIIESFFNTKGLCDKKNIYFLLDGENNTKLKKSSYIYKYDDESRLRLEEKTEYSENGDITNIDKNVYIYTELCSLPNLYFYENDVLRMKTEYKSEDDYIVTTYFDGDYRVLVSYEHGRKVLEQIFIKNREVRRRIF